MGINSNLKGVFSLKGSIILIVLLFSLQVFAGLRLPALVGSNMVLQRNTEIKVWGWGNPGDKVTVKADWIKAESSGTVGADSMWQVKVLTGNAGGPYKMMIYEKDEVIRLENIMLGEVWVCSGQSNMEFTIKMFGGWNKTYPKERDELLKERFRSIRLFTVEKNTSPVALQDCKGEWLIPDTAVVSEFSATAWFYGVELSRKLQVPIGLIATSWGGTPAEAWTARKVVDTDPDLQYYRSDPNKNSWFPTEPGILYNAMINPLLPMIIRGAIWYQGESNVTDAISYDKLFPAMIHSWRKAWGLGNFPFYYVQIAPFTYDRAVVGAMLREAQMRSLSTSNTGMVVTMDITGDVSDIHPKNKVDVGKRLALWALSGTYGIEGIVPSGPLYSGFQKEGKSIRVAFEYAGDGLNMHVSGKQPNGFMIAGSDRHFVAAKVQVDGNSLIVRSDKVKDPVAVRYAYTNTSEATLFNSMELPASTFRTDNWPLVTDNVIMKARFSEQKAEMVYDLMCQNPKAEIHYTLDGSEPNCNSPLFSSDGISLAHSGSILARACVDGTASESIGSWDVKQHKGMAARVEYVKPYADQYSASGPYALVDGVEGSLAFNDGAWQGFEGEDLDIVLDLGQSTMVRKLTLHFLSDTNSWIFLPKHVEIKTSRNGIDYDAGTRFENMVLFAQPGNKNKKEIVTIKAVLMKNAKYIKIRASNIGVCPPGHPGAGYKSWLFIDEIELE